MDKYHPETVSIFQRLQEIQPNLKGGTKFTLADFTIQVNGKDGLGGLIEEWFGRWAEKEGFNIEDPKKYQSSQTFPDYYVWGQDGKKHYLEIKTFDNDASANFDIANFQSYCESLANDPERVYADYLIFAYKVISGNLVIDNIFLKKIWEITYPSEKWPLKNQTKRGIIYNIRPSCFNGKKNKRYQSFSSPKEFVDALYNTEEKYLGKPSENRRRYLDRIQQS